MKKIIAFVLIALSGFGAEPAFTNIGQIVQKLPIGLKLREGKHWQSQAAALANAKLKESVHGRPVKMQVFFDRLENQDKSDYGPGLLGHVRDEPLSVQGVPVECRTYVYFAADQLDRMGLTTTKRSDVFTGMIGRADFTEDGKVFNLDIINARVEQRDQSLASQPNAVKLEAGDPSFPIAGQTWGWQFGAIKFGTDGLVHTLDGNWEKRGLVTTYKHIGNGVVLIEIIKGRDSQLISLLKFNPSWSEYTGWDFDGKRIDTRRRVQ